MIKQTLTIAFIYVLSILGFTTLASRSYAADNNVKTIAINAKKSSVHWIGKKIVGQHSGSVNIQTGNIVIKNELLAGGYFVIDMRSLKNEDLKDASYNKKLVNHLNSADFFNVTEYPTATAKITKVSVISPNEYSVTADFTIKGITKSVTFPTTLKAGGNGYKGNANITLDRTLWDIRYGSSSFFEGIGDKAIKNEFELKVNIVSN